MKKIIGPEETRQIPVQKQEMKRVNKKNDSSGKKPDRKKDWSYYAIIVSLILIIIPTIFLSVTLWKASKGTGTPVFGTRFNNDLEPKIEKSDLEKLKEELTTIEGIDQVVVELKTATLRINISMPEAAEKENYESIAELAEEKLYSLLPKEAYFTNVDTKLQYDYEIYVYHLGEHPTIFTRYKSSRNEEAHTQFLSDAVSPEMAEELLKRQEEQDKPQASSEVEGSTEEETDNTEEKGE